MRIVLILIVLAVLGFALWVRLVPARPVNWHRAPQMGSEPDQTGIGSYAHQRRADAQDFARLDEIIRATPRTRVLAGSLDEGMITYETRTLLWGFPDYTTVHLDGSMMRIYGRLRFGKGDMGVNKARITGWLAQLDQAG